MSDCISLRAIAGFGYHGVFEHERRDGQEFFVDVNIFTDLSRAYLTDDLADTVDYSAVTAIVTDEIAGPAVALIEKLAGRIAQRLLVTFPAIKRVEVTVHKPGAPLKEAVRDIAVTVVRSQ